MVLIGTPTQSTIQWALLSQILTRPWWAPFIVSLPLLAISSKRETKTGWWTTAALCFIKGMGTFVWLWALSIEESPSRPSASQHTSHDVNGRWSSSL